MAAIPLLAGACDTGMQQQAKPRDAGAQRIIALAPHLVELTFAAGAGDRLVGVVEFSDRPAAARSIPRIGDAFRVDLEAVAGARPDLILGWPSGNSPELLERLRGMGFRVVDLEPRSLDDIGAHMRAIGELASTGPRARAAADTYAQALAELRRQHRGDAAIRVFFQVSAEPLVTVSSGHFIAAAMEICGGRNVFGVLGALAPVVDRESVIAAAPEAIIASDYTRGPGSAVGGSPLDQWQAWRSLPAVRTGNLFVIDPDLVSVPGPRFLDGVRAICSSLDQARLQLKTALASDSA
jgi:iron complex transport system substrate-binding protein